MANVRSLIVFDKGKGDDRYVILNKKTGIVHSANKNVIRYEGNVTERMNITFGYGWRKGHTEKGLQRILKSEVDNYINESKGDSSIRGKEIPFEQVPDFVKKFKHFLLTFNN